MTIVHTQAELDAAIAAGERWVEVRSPASVWLWASGSATVRAYGSATVRATNRVAVHQHSKHAAITGGVVINQIEPSAVKAWAEFHGLEGVADGHIVVFKAVGADYRSPHGATYRPGETVTADDWVANSSCGHGLHFSPTPWEATRYNPAAVKWVACRVPVRGLRPIVDGSTPKCKARSCVVLYEVTRDGEQVTS